MLISIFNTTKCNINLLIMCKCLPVCTITHTAIDIAKKEEESKVDSDTPPGMFTYHIALNFRGSIIS